MKDLQHFFVSLLAICIASLESSLLNSSALFFLLFIVQSLGVILAHFKARFSLFFFLSFRNSVCTLDVRSFFIQQVIYKLRGFFPVCRFSFHSLISMGMILNLVQNKFEVFCEFLMNSTIMWRKFHFSFSGQLCWGFMHAWVWPIETRVQIFNLIYFTCCTGWFFWGCLCSCQKYYWSQWMSGEKLTNPPQPSHTAPPPQWSVVLAAASQIRGCDKNDTSAWKLSSKAFRTSSSQEKNHAKSRTCYKILFCLARWCTLVKT